MFENLYDAVSFLWSWHWPKADGEVTAVVVERIKDSHGNETYRLAVAYEFSLGDDGPYTGESFWRPSFCINRRVTEARRKFRLHKPVRVRFRADDPSVNRLDRCVWNGL